MHDQRFPLSIELSESQVNRLLREASGAGNITLALSGLSGVHDVLEVAPRLLEDERLSRSLVSGLLMLAAFPADGSYVSNAHLARTLGMNMSTAHRYISTLVAVGLLERDPTTRKYRLAHGR
jgi:hypothetical protein